MSLIATSRPVDLVHLARYTDGDAKLNAEVLGLFATQALELLQGLDTALANGDSKAWRMITHSLKGGARGIGAFALGDSAAEAETFDPATHPDEAVRALKVLRNRSQSVHLFIDAYLGL